ncbi:MAG: hypothetical protein AB2A00_15715 [Myxococcota bacterium]
MSGVQPRWLLPVTSLASALAVSARSVITGGELLHGDLLQHFLPNLGLMQGRIPVVETPAHNPFTACGMPYWADIQNQVLHPPTWIFSVLPPVSAMVVYLALMAALACAGMGLALQRLGLDVVASCCGGLAWALSSWLMGHHIHPTFVAVAAWMPWVAWSGAGLLQGVSPRRHLGALAASVALAITAGSLDMLVLMAPGVLAMWTMVPRRGGTVRDLGVGALLGIGLATPAWLPTVLWLPHSVRDLLVEASTRVFALDVTSLFRLLVPEALGEPHGAHGGHPLAWEQSTSVALLGWVGFPVVWRRQRRVAVTWLVLALLGLMLALAPELPLTRVPSRFALLLVLGSVVIGASAVHEATRAPLNSTNHMLWLLITLILLVTCYRVVGLEQVEAQAAAARGTAVAAVITLGLGVGLLLWSQGRNVGAVLLVVASLGEGAYAAWTSQRTHPAGTYASLLRAAEGMRGRVMVTSSRVALLNLGPVLGAEVARGYNPLLPRRTWDLFGTLEGNPDATRPGAINYAVTDPYHERWRALGVGSVVDAAGAPVPAGWNVVWRDGFVQVAHAPWEVAQATVTNGTVTTERVGLDQLRLHVEGAGGTLRTIHPALPGLEVRLDDKVANVRDDPLVSLDVPASSHDVTLTWSVPGRSVGFLVAASSLLLLLGLLRRARGVVA